MSAELEAWPSGAASFKYIFKFLTTVNTRCRCIAQGLDIYAPYEVTSPIVQGPPDAVRGNYEVVDPVPS